MQLEIKFSFGRRTHDAPAATGQDAAKNVQLKHGLTGRGLQAHRGARFVRTRGRASILQPLFAIKPAGERADSYVCFQEIRSVGY